MLEDCLKELRTAVNAQLPALLDAEDAEYAVADAAESWGYAIVLDDIASIRFEEIDELQAQELPALFLLPRGGTADNPWMTAVTNLVHTVEMVVVVADTRVEVLARRLFRTVEALRRLLSQYIEGTGVAEDPVFQTDIQRIDYAPTFELELGGLAKSAVITVDLHEVEDRP